MSMSKVNMEAVRMVEAMQLWVDYIHHSKAIRRKVDIKMVIITNTTIITADTAVEAQVEAAITDE